MARSHKCRVIEVNGTSWTVDDDIRTDGALRREGLEEPSRLLGKHAELVNEIVLHDRPDWVIAVHVNPRCLSVVLQVADDDDSCVTDAVHLIVRYHHASCVPIHTYMLYVLRPIRTHHRIVSYHIE